MKRRLIVFGLPAFLTAPFSECASLHDGTGWEHEGNSESHQDSIPYIFEHRH